MGGSSGGSSSQPTQQSTTTVYTNADPWKGVQPYLKSLYSNTNALGANPTEFYPGQTYANMDPLMQQGIGSNLGFVSNYFPSMYGQGAGSLLNQLNAMDVGNNPYVQDMNQVAANQFTRASNEAIQNMVSQFQSGVMPKITNDAVAAGGLGGSRQGIAQGLAIQSLGNNVANMIQSGQNDLANMYAQTNLGAYGQGLNAAGQAINMMPQYAQLGLMPGQVAQQAGGLYEGYQQKAIDDAMARWDFYQNEPWQRLANMNAIFSGATPYAQQSSQTTATTPAPTSSPIANVAAAGLGAYGLFNAMS